jgi:PKD repeat protein
MSRRLFSKLILLTVVVLGLRSFSGVLLAQGRSEEALQHAIAAQEKHTKVLMAINGVEGTAVGLDNNDQFVVKVYTARPGVANIPANLENIPVQVEVTGQFVARLSTTDPWPRPVPIGISTGHPDITAGTIGCRVTDGTFVYALSNNHVYANQNEAYLGDYVIQPGTYDGGSLPDDYLGELYDFEPIVFSTSANNTMDAAIAILTTDLLSTSTPSGGYGTPGSAIISPSLELLVQKYGRTTGWTHGQISGLNVTVNICYESLGGLFCLKQARFVGQITITPGDFSGGGDSGSLIVTDDINKNPIGLLFAGSNTMTIANPIGPVLARFGVTVDDGSLQEPVAPVANFQGNPTSGDAPLTVSFTDLSTGNPTSWSWNFGDGVGTSTARNPSHTYNNVGTYTVTLTATNAEGSNTETKTDYIAVTQPAQVPPVAYFSASPTSGDAPLTVNFTDLSTENPTGWSWDFDNDGTVDATTQNPSYTYNTSGTYTVKLRATNAYGYDEEIKTDYINVTVPTTLTANFVGSPTSGNAPLTVYFTDLSSGNPTSWVYDFGDGISSIWEQNPSHTYSQPGNYTVMLAVSDAELNVGYEVKSNYITVTGQTVNTPPTADFTYTAIGLSVDFTDQSTDSDGSVVAWSWNFGDGATSTAQNPSHTYAASGAYSVTLIVTDDDGAMDTTSKTVTVSAPLPTPILNVSVSTEYTEYKIGDRVYISVDVSDYVSGEPVVGATVNIQITTQNKLYTNGATTNASGVAEFQFKIKKPDGIGDYTINAEASVSGYDPGSGSTTFYVY